MEVEKVQEDLDIKRRQFAERMAACKMKEEELKKKQSQVILIYFRQLTSLYKQYLIQVFVTKYITRRSAGISIIS